MSTLSRRSRNSISSTHDKRMSKYRVTDDDLFDYTLRVAILSYLTQPKVSDPSSSAASNNGGSASAEVKEKEHYHKIVSGAISNSIVSIADVFKEIGSGSKSVKFPEKLLKHLEQKLQNIAMGKDAAYSDQLTRRVMAVFYGQFMSDSFRKQMKENRSIEELILMFAAQATSALKKEPTLAAGDRWKLELNNQIAQFVKLIREALRNVSHGVSPELQSRLGMYQAKLTPSPGQAAASDSGYETASTTAGAGAGAVHRDSVSSGTGSAQPSISAKVADMPLVMVVAKLFKIPEEAMQGEVDRMRQFCTEKAALMDLKTCSKNLNGGLPFPGQREDFSSDAAWNHWQTMEKSTLSQLMKAMMSVNPDLIKSMPTESVSAAGRPGSVYSQTGSGAATRHGSIGSRRSLYGAVGSIGNAGELADDVTGDDEVPTGMEFTYIPPNPRKFYKRLVEFCLVADLELMFSPEVDDADEVPLTILSGPHLDLINECALRWRIGQPYRVTCFMDLIKQFYERSDVPMECIPEALQAVSKALHDTEIDRWPVHDAEYLQGIYGSLYNIYLSSLYHALDGLPNLKTAEVEPFLHVLDHVRESGLVEQYEADIAARIGDLEERVRQLARERYAEKMGELQGAPGVNRALPMLFMTDEIERVAKQLDKRFAQPILGRVDLVSLFVGVQVPLFIEEVHGSAKRLFESSMNGPTPDIPIQDIFALYRRTKLILSMHSAFCPNGPLEFDVGAFFEPYVRQWLLDTDNKTAQWVQAAIAADKFEADTEQGHSSSIVDLFDSLRSPISFLQDLEWSDEYQEARFFTSLSKTISKAIEMYCRNVEELFMSEMFPRPTDYLQPQKSSAWLEKAKQLAVAAGEKKVEPFNFQPQSCVKLNNVEAARRLLDNMYNQMNVDKVMEVIAQAPPVPEKGERMRFLFAVKIVLAEGLVPLESSPSALLDTFVTLSDPAGNRIAKTRTIYETLSPRWDETFDISVIEPLWLMACIRDRALVGSHDIVGRAYICLDPRKFGDFLTHDIWLKLENHGRVLLRISMEGEKDDVQFYFGRAFRSLKRSEGDMVRIFIDKMAPFIRQSLSRPILRTLLKAGTLGPNYQKAWENVTGLYRSALGSNASEVQIPLPSSEKPRVRPEELTDVEIERAILPLFDYFDANLQTLNTYLSSNAKNMILMRVWKEILMVIEELLVPPLSDVRSEMKPLMDKEVDIVFKWLKFLRDYFYADGEGPVDIEELQNQKYRDVLSIRLYYDWHTDALMEECVRVMQQSLRESVPVKKRVKSVYNQRNLGTIKERKKEKKEEKEVSSNGETIMRILRMRPNTSDFIAQQLQLMTAMQAEQEKQQAKERRRTTRQQQAPPPVPPLPSEL
ncbi:cytoplasm protein [Coniophora puteana RWD-64-598 SS2]|uniref:Cytoplasm protein n=1 Tax=Coniophora puteana (strain RWD-64-598) TaxID=741705 RepID=A0A5M3MD85_CONPW|nr:cytoplasm protein [Coniophora puteana RWD-64-598 SS2]EIW76820.1 cytoplasm protein [Coniophora puteana RWD-64-598 SS2]